ncbi:MAG: hypothetical protein KatS3mg122_1015 [Caldimonas sp.]|nr:MAG: hypothetical protein KatS3mg122_1015 [Caldimonas sp.]
MNRASERPRGGGEPAGIPALARCKHRRRHASRDGAAHNDRARWGGQGPDPEHPQASKSWASISRWANSASRKPLSIDILRSRA